jgi:hypothetical protein
MFKYIYAQRTPFRHKSAFAASICPIDVIYSISQRSDSWKPLPLPAKIFSKENMRGHLCFVILVVLTVCAAKSPQIVASVSGEEGSTYTLLSKDDALRSIEFFTTHQDIAAISLIRYRMFWFNERVLTTRVDVESQGFESFASDAYMFMGAELTHRGSLHLPTGKTYRDGFYYLEATMGGKRHKSPYFHIINRRVSRWTTIDAQLDMQRERKRRYEYITIFEWSLARYSPRLISRAICRRMKPFGSTLKINPATASLHENSQPTTLTIWSMGHSTFRTSYQTAFHRFMSKSNYGRYISVVIGDRDYSIDRPWFCTGRRRR